MSNAIAVIFPYLYEDTWVFDDREVDLVKEPFVCGVPEMINDLVRHIPNAKQGFRLVFSGKPFPGFQRKLTRTREQYGGHWYKIDGLDFEGWLCPALFRYFKDAPLEIYVKAEEKR